VEAQDVGLPVERRLVDSRRGEPRGVALLLEVDQVVVDHAHAEPVGGDVPDPPADPAHAEDADRQLVELLPAHGVADALELPGLVGGVAEERPWPQELEEVLGPLADAGVDVFDGSVRYFDRAEFEGSPLNLSGWAGKLTGKGINRMRVGPASAPRVTRVGQPL